VQKTAVERAPLPLQGDDSGAVGASIQKVAPVGNNSAFDAASTMLGKNEVPDKATLSEFLKNGGQNLDPATTAWCAAFVNASLAKSGGEGTGKLNARSFLDWGQKVDDPQKGDVAVFSRGDPNGWQGHVGFFDSMNADGTIKVLGGNQGNSVSIANYSKDKLLGFRRAVDQSNQTSGQDAITSALMQRQQPQQAPNAQMAQMQPDAPAGQETSYERFLGLDTPGNTMPAAPKMDAGMLMQSLQEPNLNDGQRQMLNGLLEQEMQKQDPAYQLQQQNAQIGLQKNQIELQQLQNPKPDTVEINGRLVDRATGKVVYEGPSSPKDDPYTARQQAAAQLGLSQDDPAYQAFVLTGKMPREDQAPLTATDKKAILEADELVQSNQTAIEMLSSVLQKDENGQSLNDKAGSGILAGTQSFLARNDPTGIMDDAKGQATTELSNVVLNQALSTLKATFGAAPTEGERKILVDLQASVDKSPSEREAILKRAIALANTRLEFNRTRADEMRGGTYYKPGSGQPANRKPIVVDGFTIEEVD
jgi:uncharacterized protein (TIGR02594 family)